MIQNKNFKRCFPFIIRFPFIIQDKLFKRCWCMSSTALDLLYPIILFYLCCWEVLKWGIMSILLPWLEKVCCLLLMRADCVWQHQEDSWRSCPEGMGNCSSCYKPQAILKVRTWENSELVCRLLANSLLSNWKVGRTTRRWLRLEQQQWKLQWTMKRVSSSLAAGNWSLAVIGHGWISVFGSKNPRYICKLLFPR